MCGIKVVSACLSCFLQKTNWRGSKLLKVGSQKKKMLMLCNDLAEGGSKVRRAERACRVGRTACAKALWQKEEGELKPLKKS